MEILPKTVNLYLIWTHNKTESYINFKKCLTVEIIINVTIKTQHLSILNTKVGPNEVQFRQASLTEMKPVYPPTTLLRGV